MFHESRKLKCKIASILRIQRYYRRRQATLFNKHWESRIDIKLQDFQPVREQWFLDS